MQILPRQPQQSRQTQSWNEHRPAAVAGLFYPARRDALRAVLDKLLQDAAPPGETAPEKLRALIVPHAGYIYSGPVAASAYALLRGAARGIQRVILLGPAHWYPHQGLALAPARHHDTPLGAVNVDCDLAERLLSLHRVSCSHEAHAREHSLEVQLPFLQRLLPNPRILALTVGDSSAEQVAEVLDAVHSLPGNLVLVSSDLSHYHDYATAQALDTATAEVIVAGHEELLSPERACGWLGIRGLLRYARRHGLQGRLLDLRNSGDTAGDKKRVVGYGAFAFHAA